jgi:hypothetical protein
VQLQYVGFQHVQNVREYTFHAVAHGAETQIFVVAMDLAQFRGTHVGMQDGPALCSGILEAALMSPEGQAPARYKVTDGDILAYVTAHSGPSSKNKKRAPLRAPLPTAV